MRHKHVPVTRAKAESERRFSALAAVFEVVDRVGDGKRNPGVRSHKTDSPDSIIGSADPNEVGETTSGLQVDGQLYIEESRTAR